MFPFDSLLDELPFIHLDDEGFRLAMFEQLNGPIHFDPDRLSNLKFNPLLSEKHKNFSLCKELDPDSNFFSELGNCEYYIEDKFNDLLLQKKFDNNCLSLLHINIRSLQRNLHGLTNLLENLELKFSFIGITETWLRDSSHHSDISGYNFIHEHRTDRAGGGVGLYVADNFESKCRSDLVFSNKECAESLFVEIIRPKEKNLIIGVIYRPPNQCPQDFINNLDQLIANISKENKACYIMADWNLDLMKHHCHETTGEFLDIMYSRMFFPLITRPTRITSNTATLIDNIFTNDLNNYSASGLLFTDISDHLPVFTILSDQNQTNNKNTWLTFRDKSANNMAKFKDGLQNATWNDLIGYNDPNSAYGSFLSKYTAIYNTCFPLKKVKARNCTLNKPWLSKGLLKSIKKKNILYKRFLSNPTLHREQLYKKYKNKLTHSLRIAKRLYYEKKLEDYKSNAKSTWRLLNEVINTKKSKKNFPTTFNINDREISNPSQIANHFCDYFTNIGPNLAKSIPASPKSHSSFLSGNFPNSIFLEPVTEQEIIEICTSFRSGTAAGYDNISMSAVRETISLISAPLTHIINLSLSSGVVPDQMKIARVIPLFKSGIHSLVTNYRPISVLPVFSKFLERIVYNRLINFLNKYNILSRNQYGFRKNHSTAYALIQLYDKISDALDQKKVTLGLFIDLSKAFDTVNHDILLSKLEHYGVRGVALQWFKNYLSCRTQFVQYNGHSSSSSNIKCGVPQGSILGPLLFLLYINDLCKVSKVLDMILFADDTNIFYSHQDPNYLMEIVNSELKKLTSWFQANKLSINVKKSNFVIFKPRQNRQTLDLNFTISNYAIDRVNEVVFLGVILDEHLSWKSHIHSVTRKVSKAIGIIYKSSFCLNKPSLYTLYYSLVYPYLLYCVSVWGSTYLTNLKRLTVLQKRVIRIISRSAFDAHSDPIYKNLGILKFENIFKLQIGRFMYLYKAGQLPESFDNMFLLNRQVHSYDTRNSKSFYLPHCRTNIRKFSIRFQGPKFFNSLSCEIQDAPSIALFTVKLKKFLLS